jgi:hypothetical protein
VRFEKKIKKLFDSCKTDSCKTDSYKTKAETLTTTSKQNGHSQSHPKDDQATEQE